MASRKLASLVAELDLRERAMVSSFACDKADQPFRVVGSRILSRNGLGGDQRQSPPIRLLVTNPVMAGPNYFQIATTSPVHT